MPEVDKIHTVAHDAEVVAVWVREAAHELYQAHAYLDSLGVPRLIPGSQLKMPLNMRIAWDKETPPTVPFVSETGQTVRKTPRDPTNPGA